MAASQGVPSRGFWVGSGIAGGVFGAVVVAGFAETLAAAMAGIGQEIFNAAILFAAVAMLGWHNIWMRRHSSELAAAANRLGAAVRADQSLTGRVLHALVGYTAQPAGIQLVFYLATLLIIGSLMRLIGGTATAVRRRGAAASHTTKLQPGE